MPLALMGVRCFSPHNTIGLEGLVIHQAWNGVRLHTALRLRLDHACGETPARSIGYFQCRVAAF